MSIQIICAWCQRDLGKKEGDATYPVSHGICPDCERKVRAEIENDLNQNNPTTIQYERRI
jgi:hypothetical protein